MATALVLSAHSENQPRCVPPFHEALGRYWGYSSFRSRQEEIVRAISSGRDACVIMPTGGGKSLCYQLPAALAEGRTAIVISPLIALMQDQVAHLTQMGIPAVFLNSSVAANQRSQIMRRVTAGEFRLLYLSPERLVMDATAAWLRNVPISFFAIDEAHCISEWGHDFRPEYRQLSRLREFFPDRPIAAFTASATQRVRHDIIEQLQLRDPFKQIASFHRSNLRYLVKQANPKTQNELLLRAIRHTEEGNIIVYAPTIKSVEETTNFLGENGIAAIPYHGKMDPQMRRIHQEKWMADEVRVVVATMAFGLGINKASVRSVIHLGLPKSIEQYYQESGRAGRDGLPADCYLFWQYKDSRIHSFFINQITDPSEKARARIRFGEIEDFVKPIDCRPRRICLHFSETPRWPRCGQCDVCSPIPDWLELESDSAIQTSIPPKRTPGFSKTSSFGGDFELRKYLQEWRRKTAKEMEVSAFVILHDTSLDDLCLVEPSTISELRRVSGFGQKKVEAFGSQILDAIRRFREGERASSNDTSISRAAFQTLQLLNEGQNFEEIALARGCRVQTVVAIIAELIERGETQFQPSWLSPERYSQIADACGQLGPSKLKPLKDFLPPEITYEEIKLVVAYLRSTQ